MPNWCENELNIITKDKKLIDGILLSINNNELLKFIRPVPEKVEGGLLVDWCVENWGTKWDVSMSNHTVREFADSDGSRGAEISLNFDTAWSPITPIVRYLESKYGDDIEINGTYYEGGCDFAGLYENDEQISPSEEYENIKNGEPLSEVAEYIDSVHRFVESFKEAEPENDPEFLNEIQQKLREDQFVEKLETSDLNKTAKDLDIPMANLAMHILIISKVKFAELYGKEVMDDIVNGSSAPMVERYNKRYKKISNPSTKSQSPSMSM